MTKIMMREPFVKEIQPISKDLIENPSSSLVITLSKSGDALSLFSDDIWDYSATSSLMRTINLELKLRTYPHLLIPTAENSNQQLSF